MVCLSLRLSFATTGVVPSVWLSTLTLAPLGWLAILTSWAVPCMMLPQARASDAPTSTVTRVGLVNPSIRASTRDGWRAGVSHEPVGFGSSESRRMGRLAYGGGMAGKRLRHCAGWGA